VSVSDPIYRKGILSEPLDLDGDAPRRKRPAPTIAATPGLEVEVRGRTLWGVVVGCDSSFVTIRDRNGRDHKVRLVPGGFDVQGRQVSLARPTASTTAAATRTASGSVAMPDAPARIARASRICVEGIHDAELVEKVWGDDLRVEGVVVEPLHGADDLMAAVDAFRPSRDRRIGILLDHLVPGSKETRIADEVRRRHSPHVVVLGHPYVDVWQAIRPQVLGIEAWPVVPRGTPWKEGVLAALGRPHATQADVADGWRWLLSHVRSYADLEPSLLGRVEELIDAVTA